MLNLRLFSRCCIVGAGLVALFPTAHGSLNDTGITACADGMHNGMPCTTFTKTADSPSVPFSGQDAQYGPNVFHFTKLDANGNPLGSANAADPGVCVRDNVTGLVWEVKTHDPDPNNTGLRDMQWVYSWYDSTAAGNPGNPDGGICYAPGRCTTEKYIQDVNATNLCGFHDWRMPDIKELTGIVDYSVSAPGPTINATYFPNTPATTIWSATPYADGFVDAWVVNFSGSSLAFAGGAGVFNAGNPTSSNAGNDTIDDSVDSMPVYGGYNPVMLVRGTGYSSTLIDNKNGVITDSGTGLSWTKCVMGQTDKTCMSGGATLMDWEDALNAAQNSHEGGFSDWRLPNVKELQSIVDYTLYDPSITYHSTLSGYFPNTPQDYFFWTSSPSPADASQSFDVRFSHGHVDTSSRTDLGFVRLVRGGQYFVSFVLKVDKAGNGIGTVTGSPPGINCGDKCSGSYTSYNPDYNGGPSMVVILTASPAPGSVFASWGGDPDCADGKITMNADKTCVATFTLANAGAPIVSTGDPSVITSSSTRINGTVNDNGITTAPGFDYGLTNSYGTGAIAIPDSIVAGTGDTHIYADISGLACNTTFHYRATAINSKGTATNGLDKSFTTNHCGSMVPSVATSPATGIAATSVTLNGQVNTNGATTTVIFDLGTTADYGSSFAAATPNNTIPPSSGNGPIAVWATRTGLICNTLYHYRVRAMNSAGTSNGSDSTFTTALCGTAPDTHTAPSATTYAPSMITANGAQANGVVSDNGALTTVRFYYGLTDNYNSYTPALPNPIPADSGATPVMAKLVGLACGTTFHYRVVATNKIGSTRGLDQSLVTMPCP